MKINEAFEELYKLKYIFDKEIPKMVFELIRYPLYGKKVIQIQNLMW